MEIYRGRFQQSVYSLILEHLKNLSDYYEDCMGKNMAQALEFEMLLCYNMSPLFREYHY